MTWLARARSFLLALFRPRRMERDVDEELAFHVDARMRDLIAAGQAPAAARRQAQAELGDAVRWKEDARQVRGVHWIDELGTDVRVALRMLAKSPGFTVTVLITLAIGIGATTAIFSQVNAIFWRTLPVHNPGELRTLVWTSPQRGFLNTAAFPGPHLPAGESFASYSYPVYKSMRDLTGASFSDLACWMEPGELLPVVMGELGFGSVQFVSGNYFRTLGVNAAIGRTLQPDDDSEAAPAPVAVITNGFWRRAFGSDPEVQSKTLTLNGTVFAIVGVLPEGFFGLDPSINPDVFAPMPMLYIAAAGGQGVLQTQANWSICRVVGRIRRGVSDEQARAQAETAALHSMRNTPNWPPRGRVYEWPRLWILNAGQGVDSLRATAQQPVLILLTVVGVILVIACANIAGLLIARGAAREREIATRLAIGAPRARLVRQLLTESLLLAAIGGVAGLLLAYALSQSTLTLLSQFLPAINGATRNVGVAVTPDLRVLGFCAAVVMTAALMFGLLPALRATRVDLLSLLQQSIGGGLGRPFGVSAGKAMIAVQAALSIALLIGAGLFVQTVVNLRSVELGYEHDGLLYVRVEPRSGGMRYGSGGLSAADSSRRRAAFFEDVVKHLGATPGVISASAAIAPPLSDYTGAGDSDDLGSACTRDFTPTDPSEGAYDPRHLVAPKYFETMRLPLLLGRDFDWGERSLGRQKMVIVNEAFVKKFFAPGKNPIGETVGLGRDCPKNPGFATIIGVAADSKTEPRGGARPIVYQMFGSPARPLTVILRTRGDATQMIPSVRTAMAAFNADVPLFGEVSTAELLDQHIRRERLLSALLIVFGGFALLLCCVGIYGVLAYTVGGRTPEIGLRMAVGAQKHEVVTMILRETLVPIGVGIAAGIVTAFALARAVESILFGISRPDALTILGSVLLLVIIAALGAAIPARGAARVEPVTALRCQ